MKTIANITLFTGITIIIISAILKNINVLAVGELTTFFAFGLIALSKNK